MFLHGCGRVYGCGLLVCGICGHVVAQTHSLAEEAVQGAADQIHEMLLEIFIEEVTGYT